MPDKKEKSADQSELKLSERQQKVFENSFRSFVGIATDAMEDISSIAERGPSLLMMTLGAVLIVFSIAMKMVGVKGVVYLQPSEFIALLVVSVILIFGGASLRLYQYRSREQTHEEIREVGKKLIERSHENALKALEKAQENSHRLVESGTEEGDRPTL